MAAPPSSSQFQPRRHPHLAVQIQGSCPRVGSARIYGGPIPSYARLPARWCPLSALDVQLELTQVSTSASQAHPPTRTALQGAISGFLSAHLRWHTRRVQRDGPWPPVAKAASMQVAPVDDESCSRGLDESGTNLDDALSVLKNEVENLNLQEQALDEHIRLESAGVQGVKFTLFGFIMVHINFRDVNHVLLLL
uniref:Uncharacterized protein n=1 Tax=Setaria viridis TaxID=4556 RepID=A0A4U6TL06_SETVI|nr:hypothetical protein SEVIR_8G246400v2 [Setaria viridis]